MKVAIRTDASRRIGTGHVMRCLALAEALRERGAQVRFICRALDGHQGDVVRAAGFDLDLLPAPAVAASAGNGTVHAEWLEVDGATDAGETRAAVAQRGGVDWLVVDHFALDAAWERRLRPLVGGIFVVDDLADRAHDADVLFDPLPEGDARYLPRVPRRCRLLLGPSYALLRPEFARARARAAVRRGPLRSLFVSFGGVDPSDGTARALDAVEQLADPELRIDVVVGRANARSEELRRRCAALRNVRYHRAVGNVAEIMAQADLAIGASGVMTWERASVGLPALIVAVAANQEPNAAAMARLGGGLSFRDEEATPAALAAALRELRAAPQRLHAMSEACMGLTDGRGAQRVAQLLCPPPITLRRATAADSDDLLRWRNDPKVRENSLNSAEIPRADHERWLPKVLADPGRLLLIAEHAGAPVGVLRYDVDGAAALVSIHLVPGAGGQGYGPAILRAGTSRLTAEHAAVRRIDAQIKPGNRASMRAFAEAGYRLDGDCFRLHLEP